jgi:hypothetical protein
MMFAHRFFMLKFLLSPQGGLFPPPNFAKYYENVVRYRVVVFELAEA